MKHIYTLLLLMLALAGNVHAQGWPKDYKGVMLQGFYWDETSAKPYPILYHSCF